ncbi:MAG: glucokinase [Chloroflexota bacterium]|nr:glucokinase [Chloroflexota bacterium]
MSSRYVLGFDIGGTRLKSGIVRANGVVEGATVDDTSRVGFVDGVLPLLRAHARAHVDAAGPGGVGIGIGLPGIVETAFGSRYLPGKVLGIEDFPLRETLAEEFGVPVRCVNDGAAATLAEWKFGAARGVDDVVGLTLGTGVGSGVVVAGRPLETSNLGNGISIGHFTIQTGGRLCLCGNRGCAETLVSADAVAGRLREALTRRVPSTLAEAFTRDPASITFRSMVDGARQGDRLCREVLDEFVRDLGATIVTAIHAYNPTVVVLAGGPMAAADLFLPDVQAYVDHHAFIFPKGRQVEIRRARLEEHAGVLGAAAMVLSSLEVER